MAKSVNTKLRDAQIDQAVDLRAFSNNVVSRIIAVLNRADVLLFSELSERLQRMDPESFTIQRLAAMLDNVAYLNHEAYAKIEGQLRQDLRDVASIEIAFQANTLAQTLPPMIDTFRVDLDQVYTAAMSRPFQGALLKEWLQAQEDSKAILIRRTFADGYVQGRTTPQIVRDLRDTGLEVSRREASAIARTALSHMASFTKERVYDANDDLIKEYVWLSTLDARTTPQCQERDNKRYTKDKKPIGHEYPWGAGPGRLHWQCRSTFTPITKSWRELGVDMDEFNAAERASMNGQVPSDTDYAQWLAEQDRGRQIEVLGPTRAKLFNEGKLPLDKMRDDGGFELTIDELRKRHTAAFKRAGL